MRHSVLARGIAAIVAAAFAAALTLVAVPASAAGVPTGLKFETTGPIEVGFGDYWLIVLDVEVRYPDGPTQPLHTADGTVDVYLSGIGGTYAKSLAIQADGRVYFAQPSSAPLLAAGSYDVSAIYNPAPGGYYASSQTATPLSLTVTALAVTPTVQVGVDPNVSKRPVITASISGSYVDALGGAPAGTWKFSVAGKDGASVFDSEVAQPQGGTDAVRAEITSKLAAGDSYTVTSSFTPVDELAGGITVAEIAPVVFQTPGGGFGEALTAPVPTPLWLALLLLLAVLALAVLSIVFGVKLRARAMPAVAAAGSEARAAGPQRVPGDPMNVQVVTLEEMGLPEPATIPELTPTAEFTQKLPTSTTWLLSDVEPATGLPSSAEAPTERIDAVQTPDDAPTELIDTSETAVGDGKPDA